MQRLSISLDVLRVRPEVLSCATQQRPRVTTPTPIRHQLGRGSDESGPLRVTRRREVQHPLTRHPSTPLPRPPWPLHPTATPSPRERTNQDGEHPHKPREPNRLEQQTHETQPAPTPPAPTPPTTAQQSPAPQPEPTTEPPDPPEPSPSTSPQSSRQPPQTPTTTLRTGPAGLHRSSRSADARLRSASAWTSNGLNSIAPRWPGALAAMGSSPRWTMRATVEGVTFSFSAVSRVVIKLGMCVM